MFFNNALLKVVDKHVPSKMSRTKVSLHWITWPVKWHVINWDRLYIKAKRGGKKTNAYLFSQITAPKATKW